MSRNAHQILHFLLDVEIDDDAHLYLNLKCYEYKVTGTATHSFIVNQMQCTNYVVSICKYSTKDTDLYFPCASHILQ